MPSVAIVPLLIVVASWTESSDRRDISDALVSHFGLTGGAADAVQQLFARPPEHAEGVTSSACCSSSSPRRRFARTVQRIYELAWGLPACGARGMLEGLGGAIVLIGSLIAVAWIGKVVWLATDTVLAAVVIQTDWPRRCGPCSSGWPSRADALGARSCRAPWSVQQVRRWSL